MSEESSSESTNESKPEPTSSGSGGGRKLVLLGLLVIVLGMFGYDQFVTKSEFEATVKELDELHNLVDTDQGLKKKGDADGDGFITASDVSLAAGRDAASSENLGDNFIVETFSWSRVIPGMTYDAFAVYKKGEERNVLFKVSTEMPEESSLPKAPEVGEPGSVSNPVLGNMPAGGRPNGDDNSDEGEDDAASDDDADESKESGDND